MTLPAPVRVWLRCLTLAVVLGVLAILPTAAAQGTPTVVYRSPEFGYLFWWDSSGWSVQQQQTDAGSDWVQLASADSVVDIWAYAAPDVGAAACLQERLDRLQSDPALVRFAALRNPAAPPVMEDWSDAEKASIEIVLGFDTADGPAVFVAREECAAVPAAGFMLFTSVWRDAAAFNVDNALDGGPVRTLTMPRTAWTFVPSEFVPDTFVAEGPLFIAPQQILDVDGEELGILTTHTFFDCSTHDSTVVIVAEATGSATFVVDPDAFVVESDGGEVPPTSVLWLEPAIPPDNAVALGYGETALLEFAYSDGGKIVYDAHLGEAVTVGGLGGCGGGGAAPIVIDLE